MRIPADLDPSRRGPSGQPAMDFAVGERVQKRKGYRWPGQVVAVFRNRAGDTRIVVECTVPEVEGALHIYNPEQLERMM